MQDNALYLHCKHVFVYRTPLMHHKVCYNYAYYEERVFYIHFSALHACVIIIYILDKKGAGRLRY